MNIGRAPNDPNACCVPCAQSLARAGNVFLHIAGDFALEGVDLGNGLTLVVGTDLDTVVSVFQ